MKYYKCNDITEMPLHVFPKTDEYQHVMRIVLQALGITAPVDDGEELEAAKTRKHSRQRRLLGARPLAEARPPNGGFLRNATETEALIYCVGA